jgi:hypothetical protein
MQGLSMIHQWKTKDQDANSRARPQGVRPRRVRARAAAEGIDLDVTLNNNRAEQAADSTYRPNIEPTDDVGSQFTNRSSGPDGRTLSIPISIAAIYIRIAIIIYINLNPKNITGTIRRG